MLVVEILICMHNYILLILILMSLFAVNGSEDIDVLPSGVAVVSSVRVDKHSPLNNCLSIYNDEVDCN